MIRTFSTDDLEIKRRVEHFAHVINLSLAFEKKALFIPAILRRMPLNISVSIMSFWVCLRPRI